MILHIDMDAFYASVEERERPELVGKPLIVGGTPQGRGVVAAAKIASDLRKPDGFVVVDGQGVQEFLDPLPVGRLWGVGRVAGQVFERLGVSTIRQVRMLPVEVLHEHFGQAGDHLWELAHGIDERRVVPDREAKSISHETTFAADVSDMEVLRAWLLELTEQVGWRLRRHKLRGRTVQLKVRYGDFSTITRAHTLACPTNVTDDIWQAAATLLVERLPARRLQIRLLGVGVSGFENPEQVQRSLFDDVEHERQGRLDTVADQIKERFGTSALHRASGMMHDAEHRSVPRPGEPR